VSDKWIWVCVALLAFGLLLVLLAVFDLCPKRRILKDADAAWEKNRNSEVLSVRDSSQQYPNGMLRDRYAAATWRFRMTVLLLIVVVILVIWHFRVAPNS